MVVWDLIDAKRKREKYTWTNMRNRLGHIVVVLHRFLEEYMYISSNIIPLVISRSQTNIFIDSIKERLWATSF
jgi:hypothetical protein